jgi:hypothetical protein
MQPETLLPVRPSLPYLHTGIKNNQPQDKQKKKEKKKKNTEKRLQRGRKMTAG